MKLNPVFATLLLATASTHAAAASETEIRLDGIVAVVSKNVILQSDLETAVDLYAKRASQNGQKLPGGDSFRRQVLAVLVEQQVQLQEAETIGIRVNDDELNDTLRQIARNNNQTLSEFRQAVTAEGRDYREVRKEIRTELIARRLFNRQVLDRVTISQQEIDDYLSRQAKSDQQQTEYTLQRILISLSDGASPEEIEAANGRAGALVAKLRAGGDVSTLAIEHSSAREALEGGYIGTMLPANMPGIYADAVSGKEIGTVSAPLRTANGFHIIRIADKSGQKRHMVTQSKVRHIVLKTSAIRDENATRGKLANLRKQIEAGESFEDLARTHSEDSGSASEGGELDWLNPGDMTRAFDKAIDRLQPGELSAPFRTQFGWHIVQLIERREQDQTDTLLEAQAREAVRGRKASEQEELWRRRLRDEAYIEYRVAELAPKTGE